MTNFKVFILVTFFIHSSINFGCLIKQDGNLYTPGQEDASYLKMSYSDVKKNMQLQQSIDSSRTFYNDTEEPFPIYESDTTSADFSSSSIAQAMYAKLKDSNGQKIELPNAIRLKALSAAYKGCLDNKDGTVQTLNTFTTPLSEFFKTQSKYNKSFPGEFNQYFESLMMVFNKLLDILTLLHEKEFYGTMKEQQNMASTQFFLKIINGEQFGFNEEAGATPVDKLMSDSGLVVRKTSNITTDFDQIHQEYLSKNYGLPQQKYTTEKKMNVNYMQLFLFFTQVLSNDIMNKKIDLKSCFKNRQGIDIFEIPNCPIALLKAIETISTKKFELLTKLILQKNLDVPPDQIRLILHQIFYMMSKWGSKIQLPKVYEPEPDYVIPEPKALQKTEEKTNIPIIATLIMLLFV